MATPEFVTDGVTEFEAAAMNRAVMSDGTKTAVKSWHGSVASGVFNGGVDFSGITGGAVVFNAGTTETDITISGFTNPPVVVATPIGSTAYYVKVMVTTNVLISIGYFDIDTGAKITTGVADGDMAFNIWIVGE